MPFSNFMRQYLEDEPLELPATSSFYVNVCYVKTPTDISVHIDDDEYLGRLERLEEQLDKISREPMKELKAGMLCMSLVKTDMEDGTSEDVCLRSKILDITGNQMNVFLLDHGCAEPVTADRVFVLPPTYNKLPYQAVKCSLAGLESFQDDPYTFSQLVEKVLGKSCIARVAKRSPRLSLTLEDPETGVDLNESLYALLMSPRIPGVGESAAVSVSYVSTSGELFFQSFDGPGHKKLTELEELYLAPDKFNDGTHPATDIKLNKLYAAISSYSGAWSRTAVVDILPDDEKVRIQFIDYGDCEEVSVESLRSLPHDDLGSLPPQAVSCQLDGLPPEDTQWSRRAADWLMDSAIHCVIKVLSDSPLIVDVLTPDSSQSLVSQMAGITDLWDRVMESYEVIEVKYAEIHSGENVYVTWAADPTDFRVVPVRYVEELKTMMALLQLHCNKRSAKRVSDVSDLVVGQLYAAFYHDTWYRAAPMTVPKDSTSVSVEVVMKFVDFGDCAPVSVNDIRMLPTRFQQLPCLAVTVALRGVRPRGSDQWSSEAKESFSELVVEKPFIVYVRPSKDADDVTMRSSPLAVERRWTVMLVESLPNRTFVYVHCLLANNCSHVQRVNTKNTEVVHERRCS